MLDLAKKINIKKFYDSLHNMAEIGFELPKTKEYVKNTLEGFGYCVSQCGQGLTATVGNGAKTILLRADMDALPYSHGAVHSCGHDMHTAMLLGAAQILKQKENSLKNTVKLMFQPAEEILAGALDMISAGILKDPDVDFAFMLHTVAATPLPAGTIIFPADRIGASCADMFTIKISGKSCHGSTPWKGNDAASVACAILQALNILIPKECPPSSFTVLSFGSIVCGDTYNIIPDNAILRGSLRSFEDKIQEYVKKRIIEISKHIALSYNTKAEVTFDFGCPSFINDEDLCKNIKPLIEKAIGKEFVVNSSDFSRGGGSEDFAYISHKVPSLMLPIAAGHPDDGYIYPQHHPKVRFDDNVLPYGTTVLCTLANI